MRIISGIKKGKNLFTPKTDNIRPTSDKTRQAIYNILYNMLEDPISEYTILDIFAGTGALGLEGLSRGAKSATFIDIDTTLAQKNAKLCAFTNAEFITRDVLNLGYSHKKYDLIFMDAPYNKALTLPTLKALAENNWCQKHAVIVAEVAREENFSIDNELNNYYQILDVRIYGASKVFFLEYIA
ncbi:MAG: RsmD family RNA methyltransferase [Alphaproteobacteria bacterium]|nr:RsmD family RNA methyltransferase [Alphaproteobacteria bacterium]